MEAGFTCFQHTLGPQNRLIWFENPIEILSASTLGEVLPILERVQAAVDGGRYAAGAISYEAAPAFDSAFPVRAASEGTSPLAWFAIYDRMQTRRVPAYPADDYTAGSWTASISKADYLQAVDTIRTYIADGDCYQANYTFPMTAAFEGNAWPYFLRLMEAHRCRHGALLHTGNSIHCSASPELFFERRGTRLICRPMKGTCERGLTTDQDKQKAAWLEHSQKNRAENLMIVDMIRNDMGRIADTGSVQVTKLFDVEAYPTVHQMTSTVEARTSCSYPDLFNALFPCASITGAPKKRCIEILQDLEPNSRGMYTGCMGFITPGGYSRFNVAIRTVSIDVDSGLASFGTGSGVVWDSKPEQEYRECLSKVRFLNSIIPQFQLLETLYGDGSGGYRLLDRHLQRMEDSADYFSMPWNEKKVRQALENALDPDDPPARYRLLLDQQGGIEVTKNPLEPGQPVWTMALAKRPISSTNPFLYHKTTHRKTYQDHSDEQPDMDDILLYNERNELTESCRANLVLTLDGVKYTPPVRCGLLNGTLRRDLIDKGEIQERVLSVDDLKRAENIELINSVRGWIEVEMIS